jgi:hypothetical protein
LIFEFARKTIEEHQSSQLTKTGDANTIPLDKIICPNKELEHLIESINSSIPEQHSSSPTGIRLEQDDIHHKLVERRPRAAQKRLEPQQGYPLALVLDVLLRVLCADSCTASR